MTHSRIARFGAWLALSALCASAFVGLIACGTEETAPQAAPAQPESPATAMPAVPGATAAPGAPAAPAATARPAAVVTVAAPSAAEGGGTVTVVRQNVGVPVGLPAQCPPGCGVEKFTMGAYEMLLQATGLDYTLSGLVAESWSVTDDGSAYIWRIRPGIQFHGGWGELTAEDVAWTHNNANAATNAATAHDNAGDLRAHIGLAASVDKYTVNMPITSADARQPTHLFTNVVPRGVGIHSKAVFDEFGETGMLTQFIGSWTIRD